MKQLCSVLMMAALGIALSVGTPAAIAQSKPDTEDVKKKPKPPETKGKPKKDKPKDAPLPPLEPIPKNPKPTK